MESAGKYRILFSTFLRKHAMLFSLIPSKKELERRLRPIARTLNGYAIFSYEIWTNLPLFRLLIFIILEISYSTVLDLCMLSSKKIGNYMSIFPTENHHLHLSHAPDCHLAHTLIWESSESIICKRRKIFTTSRILNLLKLCITSSRMSFLLPSYD